VWLPFTDVSYNALIHLGSLRGTIFHLVVVNEASTPNIWDKMIACTCKMLPETEFLSKKSPVGYDSVHSIEFLRHKTKTGGVFGAIFEVIKDSKMGFRTQDKEAWDKCQLYLVSRFVTPIRRSLPTCLSFEAQGKLILDVSAMPGATF
jgi:hypothetical protein